MPDVELDFQIPSDGTAATQKRIVQDLLARGVDGIAISPKDPDNQTDMLNEVVDHGALLLCQAAWVAAETEPTVGISLGNVAFSAPVTPEGAKYLGLSSQAPFHLGDIKSPYVLIESMNTT